MGIIYDPPSLDPFLYVFVALLECQRGNLSLFSFSLDNLFMSLFTMILS